MKKLLILPLLVLLTGCVTYYYPETALEDGVYYAADDPSYVFNSGDYAGVIYYPWSSLDYFYLGYYPYRRYGFAYGYPFGLGYSPWGYPSAYYGYYSPRYFSYHHYPNWRPYVSTAPTGYSGHQGRVIMNRETAKIGKSRAKPAYPVTAKPVSATPSASSTAVRPPATSTANTFSRRNNRSRSGSSPSSHPSSIDRKSSRRRDHHQFF